MGTQHTKELVGNNELLGNITFIGETLGPLYLIDPDEVSMGILFEALAALDVEQAAGDWPFVEAEVAAENLKLMQQGLAEGLKNKDMAWEFRRLFIGPLPKPAPPWGSVYTDHEGVVFGETALALKRWMRESGVDRAYENDAETPDDHIGLMLILMAWLAKSRPDLLEEYLTLHFFTWSSHFLTQLSAAAEQAFYQGVTQLTLESLEGIQKGLDLDIVYPRFYR